MFLSGSSSEYCNITYLFVNTKQYSHHQSLRRRPEVEDGEERGPELRADQREEEEIGRRVGHDEQVVHGHQGHHPLRRTELEADL